MTWWQVIGLFALAWFGVALALVALMARWGDRDVKRTRWNRDSGE